MTVRKNNQAGLASALASLPTLDREELLERWRTLYGKPAPSHISRPILVRAIAYRMQEQVYGGLKPATRRLLKRVAEEIRARKPITSVQSPTLKPGTRLLREWNGSTHEVIVLEDGSCSEASAIGPSPRWRASSPAAGGPGRGSSA